MEPTKPDAPDSPNALIVAQNLTKCYDTGGGDSSGDKRPPAVDDVSFSVAGGEVFGFLGENGAGKTTTIKMLTGLMPPTSGQAFLNGHDIARNPLAAKQVLGYIPDNPPLYDKLTGREFMEFVGDLWRVPAGGARAGRIADLLELFDLLPKQNAPIGGYSRGMRQKIALASALLHNPRVLFLDEPTVGLDPKGTRLLQTVLRQSADGGAAVFLSTHVLEVAQALCDRIGILHKGKLAALGTPSELTQNGAITLEAAFLEITEGPSGRNGREADLLSHLLTGGTSAPTGV